jgi:short chain dehydrogenase
MNLFDLTSKVALVTGGNGGIGLGMAKGLVQAGAAVVWPLATPKRRAVEIGEPESCHAMVRETVARFGRLDILSTTPVNHHRYIHTNCRSSCSVRFNRWQPVERRQSRSSRP